MVCYPFPLYLKLRAYKPDANLDRAYEILVQKGLFQHWLVTLAYGRYGQKGGQSKLYIFDTLPQAQDFIQKTIKKRPQRPYTYRL